MLTETKKNGKIKKIQTFEKRKKGVEVWSIATFPQNLALIQLMFSEKTRFTDDGRTTHARDTALPLLTHSSRAKSK